VERSSNAARQTGGEHERGREVPDHGDRPGRPRRDRRTEGGTFEVKLATPKELGGAGGDGNNPEQLFATGYAACFIGEMKVAAAGLKLRVSPEATVTATVGIGPRSEGGYGLDVELLVHLPSLDRPDAERLVEAAHQICPYSNATRNNVDVRLSVA
jgi:lipoyl-dependent peroxiredoxin